MCDDDSKAKSLHKNGTDNKSADPIESDPCIDVKPKQNQSFLRRKEKEIQKKFGLSQDGVYVVGVTIILLVIFVIIIIALSASWPTTPHHYQFPVCEESACLRVSAQVSTP